MSNRALVLSSSFLLALCTAEIAAAADAGSVLFARGSVTAERQPTVPLVKGDAVLDDDTVTTGEASRAQLLLFDGAKIAIRPNSQLRIEEYVFQGTPSPESGQPAVATSFDRSVTSLIKGGFRTITGAIGKEDETAYEVRTPVGVLGIRGTQYAATFCNADCDWVPGFSPNAPIEDGLYIGVTEGIIFFRNEVMDIDIRAGESVFIPLIDRTPRRLDAPPPVLVDGNDLRLDLAAGAPQQPVRPDDDGSDSFSSKLSARRAPSSSAPSADGSDPGSSSTPDPDKGTPALAIVAFDADGTQLDITSGTIPQPTGSRSVTFATGPIGPVDSVWSDTTLNDPSQYRLDPGNNLTGFTGNYPARTGFAPGDFDINTSANVDTGFDAVTVLRWGRWAGGVATVDLGGGTIDPIDLNTRSLHWITGPEGSTPVIPISGGASYTLIGATAPTDNLGNTGVLGSATFDADFTGLTVTSTLNLDINGSNWVASGSGDMGTLADPAVPAHMFNGAYGAVAVDGISGGSGVFSGFFSGPGPVSTPGLPGGAGLTYSLQDANQTASVSGAAVFGNP